ncbi:hypothetical protein ABZ721_22750 [Streptomyces sp. NPDC006733]
MLTTLLGYDGGAAEQYVVRVLEFCGVHAHGPPRKASAAPRQRCDVHRYR